MRDDYDRVADKGECSCQRHPLEQPLLRLRDIVVDRLLHEVPGRVGRGQRLASRARRGRFGDISIRIRCGDAAEGKSRQEENEHNNRIGILYNGDGTA
jgi:hypothetical protein